MKYFKISTTIFLSLTILFWVFIYISQKLLISELLLSFLPQITSIYCSILIFISIIIILKKWRFVVILIVINWVICIINLSSIVSFYYVQNNKNEESTVLKVLSVNLLYENTEYDEIQSLIENTNPDVLILLEFSENHYLNLGTFIDENYKYASKSASFFGENLIYSKYQIIDEEYINLSNNRSGYNTITISFKNLDYKIYAIHTAAPINQEYFELRNLYLNDLAFDLSTENSERIVVAGDFNLSPWSYYYKDFDSKINEKYLDISSSNGIISTWKMFNFLPIGNHIDHFFISKNIKFQNFKILQLKGSDHMALYSELY
jgi:endonuclease/exonuclease/phosphatase (EEP) superfamily protein YafD